VSEYADLADKLLDLAGTYQRKASKEPNLYVSAKSVSVALLELLESVEMHDGHAYVDTGDPGYGYCAVCGCDDRSHELQGSGKLGEKLSVGSKRGSMAESSGHGKEAS
jgi:hypothetical protein